MWYLIVLTPDFCTLTYFETKIPSDIISFISIVPLSAKGLGGFVCVDSLRPSQQFFSYVRMGLPGLNQY